MAEETKELQEESVLLEEYKKLQESTVSKEQYEKDIKALKDKNDLYLKAITEGGKVDTSVENSGSVQDTISDISKFKGTNLEYWNKMTKAIDQTLATLPSDEVSRLIGSEGLEDLIKVNEGMKKMVEDSNGSPTAFRELYKLRVRDSAPRISSEIERAGGLVNYLEKNQK